MSLPDVPNLETIKNRLPMIFPDGIENRGYVIREMAAKSIFVMFYVGALEGNGVYVRPDQITKMTDEQAGKISREDRISWRDASLKPGKMKTVPDRWYAVNTREPIRDETLRLGLIRLGAVAERQGLPTTSAKPRYALTGAFVKLFDESLSGVPLNTAIEAWQEKTLSKAGLTRIMLLRKGIVVAESSEGVQVRFPNGETRRMENSVSSAIGKSVIEDFAVRFLKQPGVIFLSEPGNKVVARDDQLASAIGLDIEMDKNLPDIILVDIARETPLLVFVEVVATDGPINKKRKQALMDIALNAGFDRQQVAFVTAFMDRADTPSRKLSSVLAWGSFAWFVTEPDNIVIFKEKVDEPTKFLYELV